MIWRRLVFALSLAALGSALPAGASSIEVNVSDESVRGTFTTWTGAPGVDWDVSYLHNDDDVDIGALGLGASGAISGRLTLGVGLKLFFVETDPFDGGALGLGGRLVFRPRRAERVGIGGHAFWAPDAVTSGDAEKYVEYGARVEVRVIDVASLFVGYRRIRVDFEEISAQTVDEGGHFGIRISY